MRACTTYKNFTFSFSIFRKKKNDPVLVYLVIQALSMIIKVAAIVILAINVSQVDRYMKNIETPFGSYGTSDGLIILKATAVIYAIVLGKSLSQGNVPIM